MYVQNIIINIKSYQCVSIQEDALAELSESPTMELCEGDPQVGSGQQSQVDRVPTVQHAHLFDHIKYAGQLLPTTKHVSHMKQHEMLQYMYFYFNFVKIDVRWLCFTSHRQRGHLERAPPKT